MGWLQVSDHQGRRFGSPCIHATAPSTPDRLPGMVEAFAKLPARTAILDRRTVPDRAARWGALLPADDPDEHARTDEAQLAFLP